MQILSRFESELARPEMLLDWAEKTLRVIVIIALAALFTWVVRRMLAHLRTHAVKMMDRRGDDASSEMEKRANTLIAVMAKVATILIWLFALVMSLEEFGFKIEPILAGLGVAGIAVGFGAQTLVKDWLGGLFLLLEDQARIGDSVTINGISGAVEEINFRTTLLRGENGAVHVISNGSITTLSNFTRDYSYYVFEITLAHGSDVGGALAILEGIGAELLHDENFRALILAPLEIMGIDRLLDKGITLKARIKTLPAKQALVGRELNRRVQAGLSAAKITFPAFFVPTA